MHPWTRTLPGTLAIGMLSGVLNISSAQRPLAVVHYPLHLVDLVVVADSTAGLGLIVLPSADSKQGKRAGGLIGLRFEPDSILEWVNHATVAIRNPSPVGEPNGIQWSRPLGSRDGAGNLAVGRTRKKGALDKTRWLAVADSGPGWRVELDAAEADSVLRLLWTLASQSRVDTSAAAPREPGRVDVPAGVLQQPAPRRRGAPGRVVAQYVIGTDGLVEPGSFVALLASDPGLAIEAWALLRDSRFRPALVGGRPVRQWARQVITWDADRRSP